jgi:hypothetical protein
VSALCVLCDPTVFHFVTSIGDIDVLEFRVAFHG